MAELVIIDSGSANLSSVYKAAAAAGLQAFISDDCQKILSAPALIFPGVGSFTHAVVQIGKKNLAPVILDVVAAGKPFLGICLGMQLLLSASEETFDAGSTAAGLNIIPGNSKRFPDNLPVPHVGWNLVKPVKPSPLFAGLETGAYFYFTHSYYVLPERNEDSAAQTDYGFTFTSALRRGNLYGVQFHPEKSGLAGLRLIANFGKIIADQQ